MKILPNPLAKREQCVKECLKCNKMFTSMKMKSSYGELPEGEVDDCIGDVCIAYEFPKAQWRNYRKDKRAKIAKGQDVSFTVHFNPCLLASHVQHHIEKADGRNRVKRK